MRKIRDRGTPEFSFDAPAKDDDAPIFYWHIAAKLDSTHHGVGSWAVVKAKCADHARSVYAEWFPDDSRVIVTCENKGRMKAQHFNRLTKEERKWAKLPLTWLRPVKRPIRDR